MRMTFTEYREMAAPEIGRMIHRVHRTPPTTHWLTGTYPWDRSPDCRILKKINRQGYRTRPVEVDGKTGLPLQDEGGDQ